MKKIMRKFLDFSGGTVDKKPPRMQETWVRSLIWGDFTCRGLTKPLCNNYCTWARERQLLKRVQACRPRSEDAQAKAEETQGNQRHTHSLLEKSKQNWWERASPKKIWQTSIGGWQNSQHKGSKTEASHVDFPSVNESLLRYLNTQM